ncbi:lipooligosaccharide transport system ATP-binding protein [Halopolyspora algeriensis]|uniref:Lipooligosaccharide transport system ATP-binding protein n=1 Tax=Halopolyspora algeriensis TaxID=1500506 RepID=A0A368VHM8_9ACTN|nr:ABC transporter ATP-binding protein [Halopolyspora algeriensis]RCW39705.1 lipooligosaccharide transport system ATP-binding protein [Halopolyspora algeriensis]TQM54002.1 lipooligosaccharide transport system ATP-binding protein [Halopolyspora algeriensis]
MTARLQEQQAAGEEGAGTALALRGVVKRFGDITAVDHVDLIVPQGICLGLLGPNGAGKSTTMRMITGQAHLDAGSIEVLGHPVPAHSKHARAEMGVVPQLDNLDVELTARQNLEVFAHLYRVPRARRRDAVDRALRMAHLVDRADTKTDELSGGMRRRLLVARSLVHSPRFVLLDEPTVGLDPQVRQELWSLVDALRHEGVSVLMSTHYIEEAERLADEVAVMSRGRIIARGTPAGLRDAHVGREAVEYYGSPDRLGEVETIAVEGGLPTRRTGPSVSVLRAEHMPESTAALLGAGARRASNLEDVFVSLTGETVE